jgi:hypothetical protein
MPETAQTQTKNDDAAAAQMMTVEQLSQAKPIRKRSGRELREHLWIVTLRRCGYWEQIVRKLAAGEHVTQVTRWLMQQPRRIGLQDAGYLTLRRYVTALKIRVQENMQRIRRRDLKPFEYKAAVAVADRQMERIASPDTPQEKVERLIVAHGTAGEIKEQVTEAVKAIDSEQMLKHCFVIQMTRVQRMLEQEEKFGILFPHGHKNILALAKIASQLRRHEVGERRMGSRAKGLDQYRNGLLPHPAPVELTPQAQEFAKLNPVDRSLIREISMLVREMIEDGIPLTHRDLQSETVIRAFLQNELP